MFGDSKAFSGFAVDDMDTAARFYGDTLGIRLTRENGMMTLHLGSGAEVFVYPKPNHTPAEFTILNFPVEDIESAVDSLRAKGIEFDRPEGIPLDERGIMREGGPFIAWFTDPAGNVLSVLQER